VLSQTAIRCIYQFLDCYNILPHTYLCRLLAQQGLVPRLHAVLKQVGVQGLQSPPPFSPGRGWCPGSMQCSSRGWWLKTLKPLKTDKQPKANLKP
jgi:hypothetical protein